LFAAAGDARSGEAPERALRTEVQTEGAADVAWHYGLPPKTVGDVVGADGRIVNIQVERAAPLLLNVAVARNAGGEHKDWWWVPGDGPDMTGSDLGAFASRHEARVVSLAPYTKGGTTYLAAAFVRNAGADEYGWWWYFDQPRENIEGVVAEHDTRLTDLRSYVKNGSTLYALVMVAKKTPDERAWWYTGIAKNTVRERLAGNRAQLASVQVAARDENTFDVIMEPAASALGTGVRLSWAWGIDDSD
jgi:hypothetical protein